jgi:hypothetical protein
MLKKKKKKKKKKKDKQDKFVNSQRFVPSLK